MIKLWKYLYVNLYFQSGENLGGRHWTHELWMEPDWREGAWMMLQEYLVQHFLLFLKSKKMQRRHILLEIRKSGTPKKRLREGYNWSEMWQGNKRMNTGLLWDSKNITELENFGKLIQYIISTILSFIIGNTILRERTWWTLNHWGRKWKLN